MPDPAITPAPADAERESAVVSVPPRAPSVRVHPVAQAIDHLGELAAVLVAGYLCAMGRAQFYEFAIFSGAVLGVQGSIRNLLPAGRKLGASGIVSLAVAGLASSHLLHRVLTGALVLSLALARG